ncbi:hypothetical protein [Nocardioides alcanivorans]|uniref:hypothetical protein n=1 Tax=Nocardioides alcanivorans TaxID=2897352 RepID=UPI001F367B9F|nr:hypothetical protein [Nocardioides alcanivorans]
MRPQIQPIALGLVAVAVVPYMVLKLLWLSGSTIGMSEPAAVAEVQSTRMVVGNIVTMLLELLAVGLAVALTRPWGLRAPAWIVLCLAGGATGLLAPILLGLPLGSLIQFAVRADVHTSGMDNMSPWVFALAYGGFGLLAIAIAVLAWQYALIRWERVLAAPPRFPSARTITVGALGMLPFGTAMVWWGLFGPGEAGPQAMDTPSQRTALVVTGLLCIAGLMAPILGAMTQWPRTAWLVTWVGCTTAALQGPTQLLLANGGDPTPAIALITVLATPASCGYGLLVLRQRILDTSTTDFDKAIEHSARDGSESHVTLGAPRGER